MKRFSIFVIYLIFINLIACSTYNISTHAESLKKQSAQKDKKDFQQEFFKKFSIVDVTGKACMGYDKSKKETRQQALINAKTNAAQSVATLIQSHSDIENGMLKSDLIKAYTRAKVVVISKQPPEWFNDPHAGDCCRVKIKAKVKPAIWDSDNQKSFDVNYICKSDILGKPRPIKNGDVLHSGDLYRIVFKPNKKAYIYIFQIDASGKINKLFPMASFKNMVLNNFNPVQKEKTYYLPAHDKYFKLDNNLGQECIYFIVSDNPDKRIDSLYALLLKSRYDRKKVSQFEEKLKSRGLGDIIHDSGIFYFWQEDDSMFSIMNQNLENIGKNCVNILKFDHIKSP
ncbi:hypothetical protein GMMP15_1160002 [Candidatus Magnetomoraceae bacterium gMMP-15]